MKSLRQFVPLAFLVLFTVLAGAGCSTFNLDWQAAAALPSNPGDLSGRWQGTWKSSATGHSDELRCLVTKITANEYEARFHAKYKWGVTLTYSYTVPLQAELAANGQWKFSGDADLGWYAGGLYHYEGNATATNFFSLYNCKYDRGQFNLTRPQ